MATVSPSPDSAPAAIPPSSSVTLTTLSTPPQPSTQPSLTTLSTPPQPSTQPSLTTLSTPLQPSTQPEISTPPQPSTQPELSTPPQPSIPPPDQPDANPPDLSTPSPPSSPPSAPAPSGSGTPVITSPVQSSPPPTPSVPPPTPPAFPPPTSISQPSPPNPSPPPSADVSPPPPQTNPPVSSPPPLPPPPPPVSSPPSPPLVTTPPISPPPPSAGPPPISSPTPPSSISPNNPPAPQTPSSSEVSPPPPSVKPPEKSPPSLASGPRGKSPPAPSSHSPQSSPTAPAVATPSTSHPSTSNPPPSVSESGSPPSTPARPSPVSHNSPPSSLVPSLPSQTTTAQSSPSLPAHGSSTDLPQITKGSNGGIGSGAPAAIGVVAGVLMLGLIGLIALWIIKKKKRRSGANDAYIIPASLDSSPRSDVKLVVKSDYPAPPFGGGSSSDAPTDHGGFGHSKPWFTYHELSEATGGFSDQNLLGEGGFGYVYKGILADGREVAVKQLKTGGGQGEREFQAEVEIISRIHHRHLVSLVGYCIWETKRLLVYDYVPNDTLYFHLHGQGRPTMDWATRVKIAAGAARGLAYLHEDCHPRVIHRDIKSSNILLDINFEARVADFGLARLVMDADTHVSTRVMGTFGYMAPEYATSGKLTEKSDVYSFGVVLLELITGRKPVDESQPLGDESVVEWARPLLTHALNTGEFEGLVDPRLEKNYIESEMFRMIEAAAACVRHSSAKRPKMGQVVRALDGISDSGDLSNGLRVGESRMYDSAQQSAEIRWFRRVAFGSQDISSEFFNQSHGYSTQSGQNVNFSGQLGLGGDFSRQHSQPSQNLGFSRQSRQC